MTFAEITALRVELANRRIRREEPPPELPIWQQLQLRRVADDSSGLSYQKCGGGRRLVRKKIGGD